MLVLYSGGDARRAEGGHRRMLGDAERPLTYPPRFMTEREFDEPAVLARVRAIFASAPYMTALGVSLVRVGPGLCESVLAVRTEHAQHTASFTRA